MSGVRTGPGRKGSLSRRYVLDSSALLALFRDEPGAESVEQLIVADDTEVFMSSIALGEVLYIMHQHFGVQAAAHVEEAVLRSPKIRIVEATWNRVKAPRDSNRAGACPMRIASGRPWLRRWMRCCDG